MNKIITIASVTASAVVTLGIAAYGIYYARAKAAETKALEERQAQKPIPTPKEEAVAVAQAQPELPTEQEWSALEERHTELLNAYFQHLKTAHDFIDGVHDDLTEACNHLYGSDRNHNSFDAAMRLMEQVADAIADHETVAA